jgi:hypothetical protein
LHLIIFIEEFLFSHDIISKEIQTSTPKKKPQGSKFLSSNQIETPTTPESTPEKRPISISESPILSPEPALEKLPTFYDKIGLTFFKKQHSIVYDVEDELDSRRRPDGSWIDLPLVEDTIYLLNHWKIACISNFRPLSKVIGESKHLRSGGTLRITLRFIKYSLEESSTLNELNLQLLMRVIERDLESEMEMDKYRELWAATGSVDEMEDYHTRILIILYIVLSVT